MRKYVACNAIANDVMQALPKGILLTTQADNKINSMVIGWGTIGINWSKPVFCAYVRTGRYTAEMLEKNPEFTINIPVSAIDPQIIRVCGRKHGDEVDKVKEAGLTPVEGEKVQVPAFKELPLTLECKVIYKQTEEIALYNEELMKNYPQDVDSRAYGGTKDPHIMVFGEIVNSYIVE